MTGLYIFLRKIFGSYYDTNCYAKKGELEMIGKNGIDKHAAGFMCVVLMAMARDSWKYSCEHGEPDFEDYLSCAYWRNRNRAVATGKHGEESCRMLDEYYVMEEILKA